MSADANGEVDAFSTVTRVVGNGQRSMILSAGSAFPALTLPVARLGHLLALKVLARDDRQRPQDWDDIRALLREATPHDLDGARAALRLITDRGYQRDKCLLDALDALVAATGVS